MSFPQIPFGGIRSRRLAIVNSNLVIPAIALATLISEIKPASSDLLLKPSQFTGDLTGIKIVISDLAVSITNTNASISEAKIANSNLQIKEFISNVSISAEPIADSGAFMNISSNTTLGSNTKYLTTSASCIHIFPSSPSVGDLIEMATGNFDTRINHGNASQQIRNLSTLTIAGSDSGVILKPYSVSQFIYVGSNLWITGYRARITNNWLSLSTPGLGVTYTGAVTTGGGVSVGFGSASSLYDGFTAPAGDLSQGLGLNVSPSGTIAYVTLTLSSAQIITLIKYWAGQGNGTSGVTENNAPDTMRVYGGSTSALLATFTLSKIAGTEQTFSMPSSSTSYSVYILGFSNSTTTSVSVMEVQLLSGGGGEYPAT